MKIVNVSYVHFPTQTNASDWIAESRFFKGIWEAVAQKEEVHFFEFIRKNEDRQQKGIFYHFKNRSKALLRLPFRTNRAIAALKPDLVIVHGLVFPVQTILLSMLLSQRTKIVVQHHGERPFQNRFKRLFQKLSDHYIDQYFFTSRHIAQPWLDSGIIKHAEKVCEIMEIASVFEVTVREQAQKITGVAGRHTYIWVGNLNANKDPMLTVRAFTHFINSGNEGHLYMIFQSNDLLSELQHWLNIHPIMVQYIHLIGKVSHPALQDWYNSVDFIISSSHAEAGGVSVAEAISCGCIPIISDIPSFRMMLDNACGYLFPAGDEPALFRALQQSIHINKITEREKTLKQYHNHLSFEAIAEKIENQLISLVRPNDAVQ